MTRGSRQRGLWVVVPAFILGLGAQTGLAAGLPLTSQALTPYRTCTLTGTPAITAAVADTTVRQGTATTNYGLQTSMNVSSAAAANQRMYVRFDSSQCAPVIPPTATIRLATLRLFSTALPAACRTIDIFRVTTAWTETAVTWNTQPFGTALNNPASAARTDSFNVGTPTGCENRINNSYLTGALVTADVAAFVAGGASNFGWMLRDDVESSVVARTWTAATKNLGTLARAPQLIITYVVVP